MLQRVSQVTNASVIFGAKIVALYGERRSGLEVISRVMPAHVGFYAEFVGSWLRIHAEQLLHGVHARLLLRRPPGVLHATRVLRSG